MHLIYPLFHAAYQVPDCVNVAAYKVTNIEPPTVFIRLENSKDYKIKDILYKGIESLRKKVIEVQKLFKKLT